MSVKLGTLDISAFKVGSADCKVYLGETFIYSGDTPTPPTPSFDGKWLATYSDESTLSAECDATSAITDSEIVKTNLESFEIGDCVTSIRGFGFNSCSGLTSITIPNSVIEISAYAFEGTPWWSNYSVDTNNHYGNLIYINDVAYRATATSITSCSFKETTKAIGSYSLSNCINLSGVTIPSSVIEISSNAFNGCINLSGVTIPSGVTTINDGVFANCFAFSSMTIPNNITSIGKTAFQSCSGLTSVTIPDSVTSIDDGAFKWCSSLTSVTIPSGVTTISSSIFHGCSGLTSVTIPDNATSFGSSAFTQCSSLTSITIPDSVTEIGKYALKGCSGLTSIDIPSGITSIGGYAFQLCPNLTAVTCNAVSVPTLGTNAFNSTNDCPIYVPSESVDDYKLATNWKKYAARIQAIPTPTPSYSGQYLTFVATEDGTFSFTNSGMSYSLDSGTTWVELEASGNTPTVNSGDSIMWKATLTPTSSIGIGRFSSTANFTVEGNAMSLLYGDNFSGVTDLTGKDDAFYQLFRDCTTLTSAENLSLLATTLAQRCYYGMFYNCSSLTTAPELPATTLSSYCYYNMFRGCTSLEAAPQLPATTLAIQCYDSMFINCTSLTTAPSLPATTLEGSCYYQMFSGCISLNSITCLATNISARWCTNGWVNNVAASGTFTKAASMSSWTTGSNGIPSGWSVQDAT